MVDACQRMVACTKCSPVEIPRFFLVIRRVKSCILPKAEGCKRRYVRRMSRDDSLSRIVQPIVQFQGKARMHNDVSPRSRRISPHVPPRSEILRQGVYQTSNGLTSSLPPMQYNQVKHSLVPWPRKPLFSGRRQTRDELPYCARCAVRYAGSRRQGSVGLYDAAREGDEGRVAGGCEVGALRTGMAGYRVRVTR